jgi:acyl-CoA synthetase (AMP-forming)/AMP-acid ligase II
MIDAPSLWDLIERRADATPEALFAVDEQDRRLDFAQYRRAAERVAAALHARGVGEGTPIAWQLPTTLEALLLCGALARLGAVQVPILPILRAREVGFAVRQTGARRLFVPGTFRGFDHATMAHAIAAELPGLAVDVVAGGLPEADPAGLPARLQPRGSADAVRWIFYTSGTTADPKGARHTDATLLAAARGMSARLELAPDDRVGLVFPFTHVGGVLWLMNGLRAGCAQIAISVFDPRTSIDVLARHGVTQAGAGTAFHQAYLAAQRERGGAPIFPHVRAFPGGGAPKPPQLHADVKRELGGAGIVSGYGMTECPVLAMGSPRDPDEKLAHTEGRACPSQVEIRVVEGELRVKAPQMFRGYLDASLDGLAFDADGCFRTGDLGHLDADGYVVVTGRLKDVIIRHGENISARELEDLLHANPAVREVAVIGLPDPVTGERACAVLVPADPQAPPTLAELAAWLIARNLAKQKLPEQLELVAELPRNATGKVLKQDLRARLGSQAADGSVNRRGGL